MSIGYGFSICIQTVAEYYATKLYDLGGNHAKCPHVVG